MQNGKVVGVAFQGYSGDIAQGVAYMIPTPVIRRFLKDIEDGHYDRYVDLGITYSKLQNPAQRHYLGLKDDDRGVLVGTVIEAGPCGKVLQSGDVLLAIDGHPIASDAFVEYEGERVQMPEVVERKFKGDKVKLDLLRNKQPMNVDDHARLGLALLHAGRTATICGRAMWFTAGCSFSRCRSICSRLIASAICGCGISSTSSSSEQIYLQHPEVIILTNILPDPINTYLMPYRSSIVDEINGKKIGTLQDLARAFEQPADRFVVKMVGDGPPLVLDPKQVEAARERIKTRYNVFAEQNLDEQPPAKPAVAAEGQQLIMRAPALFLIALLARRPAGRGEEGAGLGEKIARRRAGRGRGEGSLARPGERHRPAATITLGRGKRRRPSRSARSARFCLTIASSSPPIWWRTRITSSWSARNRAKKPRPTWS